MNWFLERIFQTEREDIAMALNISPATKLKIAGKTAKAKADVLAPIYWRRYQKVAIPSLAGMALAISGLLFWKRSRLH